MSEISVLDLAEKLKNKSVHLVDVRTPAEYRARHVEGSESLPLDRLDPSSMEGGVALMCLSGKRARMAAGRLEAAGLKDVYVVKGGIQAWERSGLDVVVGEGVLSLEHQVRIAAGLLVLVGVILGTWVNQGFYGLSAFVGAGLVFAGITDTCAMGMLLAKAPWNQGCSSCKQP